MDVPDRSAYFMFYHTSSYIMSILDIVQISKLYGILYLTMFITRFRKIHEQHKYKKTFFKWSQDYLWSLGFMSWFVGCFKASLCILNYFNSPIDGRLALPLSLLTSPSIFCLEKQRRSEVVLFTFVRACRSAYIYLKKRYHWTSNKQKQLCFIFVYAILSYLYLQKPDNMKTKQLLTYLWGQL